MKAFLLAASLLTIGTMTLAQSESDLKEMSALIINTNGYLCASVISITPTSTADVWRVNCVENGNGNGRATYLMNAATARVTRG